MAIFQYLSGISDRQSCHLRFNFTQPQYSVDTPQIIAAYSL
ncbi:MAG: hypothetical protein SAJ72_14990 [Jaaginema sp. PMC 1080.18]|nr:hypothetical protein [Jaaginema sp. PMC 1080.18]MEC4867699.1 hypothetical protein [Jaaginema sp. PMC 1078.18]